MHVAMHAELLKNKTAAWYVLCANNRFPSDVVILQWMTKLKFSYVIIPICVICIT